MRSLDSAKALTFSGRLPALGPQFTSEGGRDARFGELDEDFYVTLRERLRAAGAIGPDIEAFAKVLVIVAVEGTEAGTPEREAQFEWIARHFIQADMTVTLRSDDSNIRVEFPAQPKRH